MSEITFLVGILLKDFKEEDLLGNNYKSLHMSTDTEGNIIIGVYVDFVDEKSCIDVYDIPVKVALAEKYLSDTFDISEDKLNTYLISREG